jgi:hypothetical protein
MGSAIFSDGDEWERVCFWRRSLVSRGRSPEFSVKNLIKNPAIWSQKASL